FTALCNPVARPFLISLRPSSSMISCRNSKQRRPWFSIRSFIHPNRAEMERAVLLVRVIVATYLSCWLPVEASACAGIQRQPEPMVGVGPDGKTREFYSASYALIIGEAKYQPDSGWRTLPDVPNDVLRLCYALESDGFVV